MSAIVDVALFKFELQTDEDLKKARCEGSGDAFCWFRKLRLDDIDPEARVAKEANEKAVTVAPLRNDIPKYATMAMASARLVAQQTLRNIKMLYVGITNST